MNTKRVRAGEAFVGAVAGDEDAQAGLRRAQTRLAVFGAGVDRANASKPTIIVAALASVREAMQAGEAERVDALAQLARKLDASRREWGAAYGEAYPREIEDLIRLGVRAGVDPNAIGEQTAADLLTIAEGYLLRLRDQARAKPTRAGGDEWSDLVRRSEEARDDEGYVAEPLDEAAYVGASELLND